MPKNEDGEFELILGNRQLLSVFFIVVVLLGVFFTMGYIVGRNSGPLATDVAAVRKESKPMVVETATPATVAESKSAPPVESKPAEPEPPKTEPVKEAPAPEPVKEAPPKKETPKKETVKEAAKPAKKEAAPEPAPAGGGLYLQLTATTSHEAEVYADVLKKKGFKVVTAQVPEKPGLVRVMVGPMTEGTVNKTRSDLTAAGFPGDKAIKRSM